MRRNSERSRAPSGAPCGERLSPNPILAPGMNGVNPLTKAGKVAGCSGLRALRCLRAGSGRGRRKNAHRAVARRAARRCGVCVDGRSVQEIMGNVV